MIVKRGINNITLTRMQEESINYKGSDMLIKGVAGSGKSVVIIKRAVKLNKKNLEERLNQRIAIFTFAKSLVKYTEELFEEIPNAKQNIILNTFDSYCWHLFREMTGLRYIHMQNENEQKELIEAALQQHYSKSKKVHRFYKIDTDFWIEEFMWIKERNIRTEEEYCNAERKGRGGKIRIRKEERPVVYQLFYLYETLKKQNHRYDWSDMYMYILANAAKIPPQYKLDYILIDEAQDFTYAKLKTAKLLTKKEMTIAADQAQKIYKTNFSWIEIGIDIRGRRTKTLEKPFRSTKQIVQLASALQNVNRLQSGSDEFTDVILPEREGDVPRIFKCSDVRTEHNLLLGLIRGCVENNDVTGILFRSKADLESFKSFLYQNKIPYEEISRNTTWSVKTPGIKLSTLHSSKGLEFDSVIIPYLNDRNYPQDITMEENDPALMKETLIQERSLLYVGMTRSRYDLYMTYNGADSLFMRELNPEHYEYYNERLQAITKPEQILYSVNQEDEEDENKTELTDYNVRVGLIVEHPLFGQGEIIAVKERADGFEPVLEINFNIKGTKKVKLGAVPMYIV